MIRLIRTGVTRDVVLVGRWAIKVPTARYGLSSIARGILANQSEAAWTTRDGHVAPVLFSMLGGIVNLYPRCEPIDETLVDVESVIGPLGCPPPDRKADNLGMLDGRVVWLDYDYSWNGCPGGVHRAS